jgi:alpha-tubulin suppressor-like RCC1 family protein
MRQDLETPWVIPTEVPWSSVAPGTDHALGIKADGSLWIWGWQSWVDPFEFMPVRQVGTDKDWVVAAAGMGTNLAIKEDGSLWAWGRNESWQLGVGRSEPNAAAPLQVGSDQNWADVKASRYFCAGLKDDGSVWTWGTMFVFWDEELGESGDYNWTDTPRRYGERSDWKEIAVSDRTLFMLSEGGELWAIGGNIFGDSGTGDVYAFYDAPRRVGDGLLFADVEASGQHAMARGADGRIYTWGDNSYGQLGLGVFVHDQGAYDPYQVSSDPVWEYVSAGDGFSMAIKADGTLWAWGMNGDGQLGIGDRRSRGVPVQVGQDDDWASVSCGVYAAAALKDDGSLWAWGSAIGTSPQEIGGGQAWLCASSGYSYGAPYFRILAVRDDGSLWGRGYMEASADELVRIGSDSDWSRVVAGRTDAYALKSDGSLWAWGDNAQGKVGNGDNSGAEVPAPVRIGTDDDWINVAASGFCAVAQKADTSVWAWGNLPLDFDWIINGIKYSPVKIKDASAWFWGERSLYSTNFPFTYISNETLWAMVSTDDSLNRHAIAVAHDGTLWAWGLNHHGQFGTGSFWTPQDTGLRQ